MCVWNDSISCSHVCVVLLVRHRNVMLLDTLQMILIQAGIRARVSERNRRGSNEPEVTYSAAAGNDCPWNASEKCSVYISIPAPRR